MQYDLFSVSRTSYQIPSAKQIDPSIKAPAWKGRSVQGGWLGLRVEQIKIIALRSLGLFSAFCALMGMRCVASGWWQRSTGLIVIPAFLLLSFFSIWRSFSIDATVDPITLKRYGEEARGLRLSELVDKHGWAFLFKQGIIEPEVFTVKYREHVQEMPLCSLLAYYEEVYKHLHAVLRPKYPYHLPLPTEFREKWIAESKDLSFEQIVQQYSIEQLQHHGILETAEALKLKGLKQIYENAKAILASHKHKLDQQFTAINSEHQRKLEESLSAVQATFKQHPSLSKLYKIDLIFARGLSVIHRQFKCVKERTNKLFEDAFLNVCNTSTGEQTPSQQLRESRLREQLTLAIKKEEERAQSKYNQLNHTYAIQKKKLMSEIATLQKTLEEQKKAAYQEYEHQTAVRRAECKTILAPQTQIFEQAVSSLNVQYNVFRKSIGWKKCGS